MWVLRSSTLRVYRRNEMFIDFSLELSAWSVTSFKARRWMWGGGMDSDIPPIRKLTSYPLSNIVKVAPANWLRASDWLRASV